jgi:hypothetical protein
MKKEFYKNGIKIYSWTTNNSAVFELYGLESSFDKAVELLELVLSSAKPDSAVYQEFVQGILKKRADAKLDKNTILRNGLFNYGKYGAVNPFTNIVSSDELVNSNPETYCDIIKNLSKYPHRFVYCGGRDNNEVISVLSDKHKIPQERLEYPVPIQLQEQEYSKPRVYIVDYDMVQVIMMNLAKDVTFAPELLPEIELFNEYFGSGLSSIVFQDIRESKGLAYTAFANFSIPATPDKSFYLYTYVGTQSDKLGDANNAIRELLNNMPKADIQFTGAKDAVKKKIETDRKVNMDMYWHYKWHTDRGLTIDSRKDVYSRVNAMTISDLENFFNAHIQNKQYSLLILGDKELLDMKYLGKIGDVKVLTLEEIFNY